MLTRVTLLAEVLREHYLPIPGEGAAGRFDARHALDRLLLNSRAALQTMRDVVWGIDSRADSVAVLLYRMREHLDQTATAAGLVATFSHAGLGDNTVLPASTRQHLFLIFKEAVVAARAPAQGQVDTVGVLEHGLHDDVGPRQALLDERQRLQPAHAGQAQVEQHHGGGQRVGQLGQELLGRFADQHQVQARLLAQVVAEQPAHFGVVFDDGQVERVHAPKHGPRRRQRRRRATPPQMGV